MKSENIAIISYLTPLGGLIAYFLYQDHPEKTEYATKHLRQALGIHALWLISLILSIIPFIGLIQFAVIFIWIIGFYKVISKDTDPLIAGVGDLFQDMMKDVIK